MTHPQASLRLVPVKGCWVSLATPLQRDSVSIGEVNDRKEQGDNTLVLVKWRDGLRWHQLDELRCGFQLGFVVKDQPVSNTRHSLGTGTIRAVRTIGDRELALVQLHTTGESRWLPYENLARVMDARLKFPRGEVSDPDAVQRFRLKALAYALDSWNQVTGSLDRLDVDPLPHQIDLVHRIMTADQRNWLIADDVGLGKTIEVGLLLAAMKRQRQVRRVLVVCPAAVVRQWQDEMKNKFNEEFRIYGLDFSITTDNLSHWRLYEKVIVSIDRAKTDNHLQRFMASGVWDVIVCDEAHHLSKIHGQATTLRYNLLQKLRLQTDACVFLTGTPHQGHSEQFVNLLNLLRPDLHQRLRNIFFDNQVVPEMVLRNRKSLATDVNGEFLFRGQDTRRIEVALSTEAQAFSEQLLQYLRNGYSASRRGGVQGRAIGFVMTTYRKLASSSIKAIEDALNRRLARLERRTDSAVTVAVRPSAPISPPMNIDTDRDAYEDGTDGDDNLGNAADSLTEQLLGAQTFFTGEKEYIEGLLASIPAVKTSDLKLESFLSEIATPLHEEAKKLLVFTEYRSTQDYLVEALQERFPLSRVLTLNGGMSLEQKRETTSAFANDDSAMFLVSTEAGGEGINLHYRCHVMANYDLPWNPSRLVQRAGRLYRYGQNERVMVFNLTSSDGFDNQTLGLMLQRVYAIAQDMAHVSAEYQEGMETEIVGELLERLDMAELLANSQAMNINHTEAEVEEALRRAREAKEQQDRLFANVKGYDPTTSSTLYALGASDVLAFLEGILPYKGITYERRFGGRALGLNLPPELIGAFSEFRPRASNVVVTADRQLAQEHGDIAQMDFRSEFFKWLIEYAQSPEFRGEFASVPSEVSGALALFKLRWQNDQGVASEEELLPVFLPEGKKAPVAHPRFFGDMLTEPADYRVEPHALEPDERRHLLDILDSEAAARLTSRCTMFRHPNDLILLAAADLVFQ
ncbi:MAG: DEAD/DEAH box helicase [Chloroflexi bacterium]|nr:DEAD/DEAH box helicase [Chloroflexota bacterium]